MVNPDSTASLAPSTGCSFLWNISGLRELPQQAGGVAGSLQLPAVGPDLLKEPSSTLSASDWTSGNRPNTVAVFLISFLSVLIIPNISFNY